METNGQQNSDRDMIPGVNNFKGGKITIIQQSVGKMLFSRPQAVTQLACQVWEPGDQKNMNLKRTVLEQEREEWASAWGWEEESEKGRECSWTKDADNWTDRENVGWNLTPAENLSQQQVEVSPRTPGHTITRNTWLPQGFALITWGLMEFGFQWKRVN